MSGPLDMLLGDWVAEGRSPDGAYRCTRRFATVQDGQYVQLDAHWQVPGATYDEVAFHNVGGGGPLRFWSFTSDGGRSTGEAVAAGDLPPGALAFEADMPAGRARLAYWREDTVLAFAAEARTSGGWARFAEHRYSPRP